MKKILIMAIALVAAGILPAQELTLDEAITRAARGIEETLPQRAMVLVLNFAAPSAAFSDYVLEELTDQLIIGHKLDIVDRQNLSAIRTEMNLQLSGDVSDESALSIGKMLGAHYIVSGSLTDRETNYRFRIRIISVETARILTSIILELKKDTRVARLIGGASAVRELEQQQQEAEKQQRRIEKSIPTSNVRNNWVSAELSGGFEIWRESIGLSAGIRYERMLNSKISLGADFYLYIPLWEYPLFGGDEVTDQQFLDTGVMDYDRGAIFGIDAFFRFYPWGRKFFLGIGLGYYDDGNKVKSFGVVHSSGFAASAELGFKIDVGKEGSFFIQPGILGSLIIGKKEVIDSYENSPDDTYEGSGRYKNGYFRVYIGVGWAF